MLTLFTTPKPFRGHIAVIQRNAIRSWTLLRPACEVILFGDDEGTAEAAAELGLRHEADVARNEFGTPLLSDLFEKAQRLGTNDLLCYINADVILMNDFMRAVEQVVPRWPHFLMVGRRWDLNVEERLDFGPHWEECIRALVSENGQLYAAGGVDFFVFRNGLWGEIPPFALGRPVFDNWLLYRARSVRAPVIDATPVVTAVHQTHDYSHSLEGTEEGRAEGVEATRNLELAGGHSHVFTVWNATHLLTPEGPKWALDRRHLWYHLNNLPTFHPYLRSPVRLLVKAIDLTYPLRARLGFTLRREGHGDN